MRTAQELYEQIVLHLRKQGKKSTRPNLGSPDGVLCVYRSNTGLSCAIGCTIPPEEYNPAMENKDVYGLLEYKLLTKDREREFNKHIALLSAMQRIHDSMAIDKWETNFRIVADEFKLEYPAL
jgi:uncharacterized LabA/DUF88 family protein